MKAKQLVSNRTALSSDSFAEVVVWQVPTPLAGSVHSFKYRLAYVVAGVCVLRYDNEVGKGGHRHARGKEAKYRFVSVDKLVADFFEDVRRWRDENSND